MSRSVDLLLILGARTYNGARTVKSKVIDFFLHKTLIINVNNYYATLIKPAKISLSLLKVSNMGRKTDLKPEERQRIAELLSHSKTSLDISKLIHRDHRTVKRFMENSNKVRGRADKGKFRKISRREISTVKKTLSRNPHSTSAKIFHEAGVPSRSRAGRCKILRSIGKVTKPTIKPPLKQRHKLARLDRAKSCMKTNFENVLFTDESRATLDGSDGWMSGWLLNGTKPRSKIRRQQGGGGVMIWAEIINDQIVRPFRVPDGVKMCAKS